LAQQDVEWKPFQIQENKIPEKNQQVKLEFFMGQNDQSLGSLDISMFQLLQKEGKPLKIMKNGFFTGSLLVKKAFLDKRDDFLSYIYLVLS
jgi:hypothetical protein